MRFYTLLCVCLLAHLVEVHAADGYWHGQERVLQYAPEGEDFVAVNGKQKFTRALYGTNTGFRVETSDVPEFGLYMPNMGGNLQLGVIRGNESKWLGDAERVKAIYRPGARIYEVEDKWIGKLRITVLAMADAEGVVLQVEAKQLPAATELVWAFGGASDERFSREGDIGVDPSDCFALKPNACASNIYALSQNTFQLFYGKDRKLVEALSKGSKGDSNSKNKAKALTGVFPENAMLRLVSPYALATPFGLWQSSVTDGNPMLAGTCAMSGGRQYYLAIQNGEEKKVLAYPDLSSCFSRAEEQRSKMASTVKIQTPDSYFNTLGGALSMAADAIWEPSSWLHGAVGWRMRLNGWRAAYTGDVMGWHDRARAHFDGYAASQVVNVEPTIPHPMQDTALHLARAAKKWGTQMYSNGYICRNPNQTGVMHHYDMNLCYIDELLWHFNWTGDMDYVRSMWPVLERHLAWEKRNFDPDNDGLYDAYCCIWASDALQYNSGAVTHSSAYNYRANKMAAEIAQKIGKDPKLYADEANKILTAINQSLWMDKDGHWAEYKDFMGLKRVHPNAAVWTIYHAIDSKVHDEFQAYQATRYVDTKIPHIPVLAKGLNDEGYATISTTNWMPYSWSINNVAFAEVNHTALAYWQSGRYNEAFKLFKSSILDGMYLGASPGNFGQVSFYDAARGECYRDFGDPVGITSRTLVQGLFGINPDAMNKRWVIRPGFPDGWSYASISTPDVEFDFKREVDTDAYTIKKVEHELVLLVKARAEKIETLTINGKKAAWSLEENAAGYPLVKVVCKALPEQVVEVKWGGSALGVPQYQATASTGSSWHLRSTSKIVDVFDPQGVFSVKERSNNLLSGSIVALSGPHTLFVCLEQGQMKWWQPIDVEVTDSIAKAAPSFVMPNEDAQYEMLNMDSYFNASVSQIFKNTYLTPRSPYTTLQVPTQGIGEWCHPLMLASIDDSGLRAAAKNDVFTTPFGLPFRTPSQAQMPNISFTSLWDNYPEKVDIPLKDKAFHVYLLMAGSTNHMQCHMANAVIKVRYADGSIDSLELVNPENWAPIEQDFYVDGHAFTLKNKRPYRVHFKSGMVSCKLEQDLGIKGVYGRSIEGGAGIILDMQLDPSKNLKSIAVETLSNEVVVGLMAITLVR